MKKSFIIGSVVFVAGAVLALLYFNSCGFHREFKQTQPIRKQQIRPQAFYPAISRKPAPDFTQGIYITGYTASLRRFDDLLSEAKSAGINTVVFDVKEMQGYVYFNIDDSGNNRFLLSEPLWKIENIIRQIHAHDMIAVARIVQFFNIASAEKYSFLQPKNRNGGYWQEKAGKATWLDPSLPEVQNDLRNLIRRVCQTEVDEIQLDYVRFPTEGNLNQSLFYYQTIDESKAKSDTSYIKRERRHVITEYVRSVKAICDSAKVRLGADIFAIVAWQTAVDIRNTGQDIALMTQALTHLHPMIYSSHFAKGFHRKTDDFYNKPYDLLVEGLNLTQAKSDSTCAVTPYLQAFDWKVHYTKEYLFDQLKAVRDTRCQGYLLWNAGNRYDRTLQWIKEWNSHAQEVTDNVNQ